MIGNADVDPSLLANNLHGVATNLGLNGSETNALESVAQAFRTEMVHIRQSEKQIAFSGHTMTDGDRASISGLISTRDEKITGLATTFINSLRPTVAQTLLNLADAGPSAHTTKGANTTLSNGGQK